MSESIHNWSARWLANRAAWQERLLCLGMLLVADCATATETNVAPYSRIRSTPYVGASIAYLTDGKVSSPRDHTLMLAAPLPIRTGQQMPLQYEFIFPQRLHVTRVRLLQHDTQGRTPASGYVIELDTKGDGQYDTVMTNENRGRGGEWFQYSASPETFAYGLRFRTTQFAKRPGPSYGSPVVEEFEIYTDTELTRRTPAVLPRAPLLREELAHAKPIADDRQPEAVSGEAQFRRGLVGSMWLYWSPGQEYDERSNDRKIALLRRLQVNRYWLYSGVYVSNRKNLPFVTMPEDPDYLYFINRQIEHRAASGANQMRIVPFASHVVPGYRDNVLRQFVTQMHANGVRVIANELLLPYGLQSWDFPRVANAKIYPSVLSSSFVRDASTMLYREFMEAGVDGLALGGDEYFFHGGDERIEEIPPFCRDTAGSVRDACKPTSQELFNKRFGMTPDKNRDRSSPLTAKWKVFEYEQLAGLFANYGRMMKSANPDAIVTSLFRPGEENRPAYGVAYDVMGSIGAVAEMSSDPYWSHDSYLGHYYFANETKKLIGASPTRTATITLQTTPRFDREGYEDPIMIYGPAFSALMHGARGINYYKQDYLFANGRNDAGPWVKKFFDLTAFLERKGLLDFRMPKTVALVYSRASEDWWQLAHGSAPVESAEAILYQNAAMEVLFRNGLPFDLYFLDQPASLGDVGKYAMALLPYPYSIAREAAAKISEAVRSGTKLASLKRNGEVDEFGEPHGKPLLLGLQGLKQLTIDLTHSSYEEFSDRLVATVVKDLGPNLPLTLEANGKDVECAVREKQDARMMFCLNWEKESVEIGLGIRVPPGSYLASVITLEHEAPATIANKSIFAPSDLERFSLALKPGEAKILLVTPVKKQARLTN
jgi:hypothetical protein